MNDDNDVCVVCGERIRVGPFKIQCRCDRDAIARDVERWGKPDPLAQQYQAAMWEIHASGRKPYKRFGGKRK